MPQIFVQEMIRQISVAEPIIVKEAQKMATEDYFLPAVEQLKTDFDDHVVTQELDDAAQDPIGADNISNTLVGLGHAEGRNLYAFIGFTVGETPTDDIRAFLDPSHPNGPKIRYIRGSQVRNLVFSFLVQGPDKRAIYKATPLPRFSGNISWSERIELGIPGITNFLNKPNIPQSESTGGIQTRNRVRDNARFLNRSYLSSIFGTFIARFK